MRRLPHLAALLRPTEIVDDAGDTVDGPLAPVGEPFGFWLQQRSSLEGGSETSPVVTATVGYFRTSDPKAPSDLDVDDVLEVDGKRYRVEGEPYAPVNPHGRARFWQITLERVSRGGK